ncbi:hypothetical protein DKX38_020709 [Salix brachista]|uniref:Uncharacterized protein n=1 Tax=Salix brachista TaxID=2182728 RepID=A0A5N5K6L1_9ROSI|nr:hypothetical protein DKX38_020709 [Salix brachista]
MSVFTCLKLHLFLYGISLTLPRHRWSLFWNHIPSPIFDDIWAPKATESNAKLRSKSFWLQTPQTLTWSFELHEICSRPCERYGLFVVILVPCLQVLLVYLFVVYVKEKRSGHRISSRNKRCVGEEDGACGTSGSLPGTCGDCRRVHRGETDVEDMDWSVTTPLVTDLFLALQVE